VPIRAHPGLKIFISPSPAPARYLGGAGKEFNHGRPRIRLLFAFPPPWPAVCSMPSPTIPRSSFAAGGAWHEKRAEPSDPGSIAVKINQSVMTLFPVPSNCRVRTADRVQMVRSADPTTAAPTPSVIKPSEPCPSGENPRRQKPAFFKVWKSVDFVEFIAPHVHAGFLKSTSKRHRLTQEVEAQHRQGHLGRAVADQVAVAGEAEGAGDHAGGVR
jgi:hypothetical protein